MIVSDDFVFAYGAGFFKGGEVLKMDRAFHFEFPLARGFLAKFSENCFVF